MKKILYLILLTTPALFSHCKKDKDLTQPPSTEQVEFDPNKHSQALKGVTVQGSEKILFDSINRAFIVQMPQSFKDDRINIELDLQSGIELLDSTRSVTTKTDVDFAYKGSIPLQLSMQPKGKPQNPYYYAIYVSFPGPPEIELLNHEIPASISQVELPIKIISGVGTIPSNPRSEKTSTVKLVNPKNSKSVEGSMQSNLRRAYFPDVAELVNVENLSLEFDIEEQKVSFEGIHLKRSAPSAVVSSVNSIFSKKDTIVVQGGYFLSNQKYSAQFSNDFSSTPITIATRYRDPKVFSLQLNNSIADGSYLVTFREGENVIGKSAVYISNGTENGLETVWKGDQNMVFATNTKSLSFNRGDSFYAKPLKPQFAHGSSAPAASFDIKLLPTLKLRSGNTVVDLKPTLEVVSWGIAGVSFSIGKYKIPENTKAGSYDVLAVFPGNKESKPYWSKMKIQ